MEMRRLIGLFIVFLSTSAYAHEVQLITQHIKLNRQNDSAWQSDLQIFGPDSIGVFLDPSRVQDIDTESQWLSAERKFQEISQSK